jgi:hypothetical protein
VRGNEGRKHHYSIVYSKSHLTSHRRIRRAPEKARNKGMSFERKLVEDRAEGLEAIIKSDKR